MLTSFNKLLNKKKELHKSKSAIYDDENEEYFDEDDESGEIDLNENFDRTKYRNGR